jgi:hypothetical protein
MPLESNFLRRALRSGALVLGACAALAACETRTDVSATGNAPSRYAHVYLTVQSVWFNADAAAAPSDTTWKKFDLSSPVTIDVIGALGGTLASLASQLSVPAGTYAQMRLLLVDTSARLQGSAVNAGAIFNNEVDFFDNTGIEHILPLQTANSAQGIGTALTFTVTEPTNSTSTTSSTTAGATFIGTSSTNSSTSTGTTSTGTTTFGTTSTSTSPTSTTALGTSATTTTTGTTSTSTTGTSTSTGTTGLIVGDTVSTAVSIDAKDELVPVNLSSQLGFVLNPHVTAYDLSQVGHIAGQVNATALPVIVGTGRPAAEVSAETLSSDGSRHIVVASTALRSDGSFVLYPLPNGSGSSSSTGSSSGTAYSTGSSSSSSTQQYDLVIHGPGIGTVIIKSVALTSGAPTGAATVQLSTITLAQTGSYNVNVASSGTVATPGATAEFFQTLPASGEVPYLIDRLPIDPFAGNFVSDQPLSSANLSYVVYDSSFTVNTTVPAEGAGIYQVALSAPLYADGPLGSTVAPPAAGSTATSTFSAAALSLPAGASAASVSGTVNVATPGKYDRGELVLTHDGAIIATAPLDSYLSRTQSSATFFDSLPGGGASGTYASGLYDAEVWVWNSTAPTVTLAREPSANPIDVRSGSASGITLNIT